MEMYGDGNIHFLAPLAKQNQFYVPECGDDTKSSIGSDQSSKTESSSAEEEGKDEDEGSGTGGEHSSSDASSFEELNVNESDLNVNDDQGLDTNEAWC